MKHHYVYIMASRSGTIYVGVTNDLERRVYEHQNHLIEGFTKRYKCTHLVYYEVTPYVNMAIAREKEIKGGTRKKKVELIMASNPTW